MNSVFSEQLALMIVGIVVLLTAGKWVWGQIALEISKVL